MKLLSDVSILIVDDNADLLDAYEHLLKAFGFKVETATNGKEAWERLQSTQFDVVFSDINLPIMTGIELLTKIRQRDHSSPCVLLSSGHTEYPADMLYQMGANGFLAKPIGSAAIKDALARASLQIEDLWKNPAKPIPSETISRKYKSFDDMLNFGEVRFGNGGFCMKQQNPSAQLHSGIKFSFQFENTVPFERIEGSGVIQWVHLVDSEERKKGLGIEIKHLSDNCRTLLCNWIREQKFEAYIPIK